LEVNGTARMTVCEITSDRATKRGFASVNARAILERLAALPLTTWSYTNSPSIRHLGPVAQDFAAAFALGEDDKHIATVDADGVLFASVQALHQLVQEKDARITALEKELAAVKSEFTVRLAALEKAFGQRLAALEEHGSVEPAPTATVRKSERTTTNSRQ
jgi:hypothetical protein